MKVVGIIISLFLVLNVALSAFAIDCHLEDHPTMASQAGCNDSTSTDTKEHGKDVNHCKMHCMHHASYFVNHLDIEFISSNSVLLSEYSFVFVKTYLDKPLRPPLV